MAEFARMGNAEQVPIVVHRLSSDQRESGEIKPVVFYERLETLVLEGQWRKNAIGSLTERYVNRLTISRQLAKCGFGQRVVIT